MRIFQAHYEGEIWTNDWLSMDDREKEGKSMFAMDKGVINKNNTIKQ